MFFPFFFLSFTFSGPREVPGRAHEGSCLGFQHPGRGARHPARFGGGESGARGGSPGRDGARPGHRLRDAASQKQQEELRQDGQQIGQRYPHHLHPPRHPLNHTRV